MSVSAKDTTAALKRAVFPLLKDAGFDDWTGRKAWRRRNGFIDTIEFRSLSSYEADMYYVPTASFSVWIGTWPDYLKEHLYPPKNGPKGPRPTECEMPFRGHLNPKRHLSVPSSRNKWMVKDVDAAHRAAQDVMIQLMDYGLEWLTTDFSAQGLLDVLLAQTDGPTVLATGPNDDAFYLASGNTGSPAFHHLTADLAMAVGDFDGAAERYEKARWFFNLKTGDASLFLSKPQDNLLVKLAQSAKRKAAKARKDQT